jgi:hypothetical protein
MSTPTDSDAPASPVEATGEQRIETVALEAIRPYWRNPRVITDEAVDAVVASIEAVGYVSPIVIDEEGVIVAGHTRYAALRRLGYEEVEVLVAGGLSEAQAKQYRVLDNRTAERSKWDDEALLLEIRDWEDAMLTAHFPKFDLHIGEIATADEVTLAALEEPEEDTARTGEASTRSVVEMVCPSCFTSFEVDRESLPQPATE